MSQLTEEANDAPAAPAESPAPAENEAATNASLEKKFRTITGEEILRHTRPSFMAFFGYYVLAVLMLGVHWLFFNDNLAGLLTNDDSSAFSTFCSDCWPTILTFMGVAADVVQPDAERQHLQPMVDGWMLLASVAPLLVVWTTGSQDCSGTVTQASEGGRFVARIQLPHRRSSVLRFTDPG
ncbi:MAG: hypothetical protein CM15mP18_0310 [Methanobacteriota archaeon]|nr:MAG: hypothetical protein CM15mP18_0310 [Euryarchaeota archaeon]